MNTATADEREAARLIRELDKIEGRKTDPRVDAIANATVSTGTVHGSASVGQPMVVADHLGIATGLYGTRRSLDASQQAISDDRPVRAVTRVPDTTEQIDSSSSIESVARVLSKLASGMKLGTKVDIRLGNLHYSVRVTAASPDDFLSQLEEARAEVDSLEPDLTEAEVDDPSYRNPS